MDNAAHSIPQLICLTSHWKIFFEKYLSWWILYLIFLVNISIIQVQCMYLSKNLYLIFNILDNFVLKNRKFR